MNDLIKQRDERTERRKKYKKKVDSMFNLSYKDDEKMSLSMNIKKLSDTTIRLLDEGAIVGDEYIDFIIKKGTLQKYMDGRNEYLPNLEEGFVGSVNLGHMDFATFPFIIGEWTKADLSLVDIDDESLFSLVYTSDKAFCCTLAAYKIDILDSDVFVLFGIACIDAEYIGAFLGKSKCSCTLRIEQGIRLVPGVTGIPHEIGISFTELCKVV